MKIRELTEAVGYEDLVMNEAFLKKYGKIIVDRLTGNQFYRGMRASSPYVLADGANLERKSANTANYFTAITDVLPSWNGWPPRSKSFICSSRSGGSSGYGKVYSVVPLENQPIAICKSSDFWDFTDFSKWKGLNGIWDMSEFNYVLKRYTNKYDLPEPVENADDVKHWCAKYDSVLSKLDLGPIETSSSDTDALLKYFKEYGTFNFLNKLFDPVENDATLVPHADQYEIPAEMRELWLSGKVLFVDNPDDLLTALEDVGI